MRPGKVLLVFRKDWREISRNWQVLMPIMVVPLLFTVAIPAAVVLMPELVNVPTSSTGFVELMLKNLPSGVQARLAGMTEDQVMTYVMLLYFFAPFFLIIPLMASSVIASDSFAGEKERKTIEALLATPITDGELFMGKVLVSFVPSMLVTAASFAIYTATVDLLTYGMFGRPLLPNLSWALLILGLAPTVALASIGLTVMISARVKGFREAQQISAVLVVPILVMLFAQASGTMVFGYLMVGALTLVFILVDVLLFRVGVRIFQRDKILSQGK
jgi:ABC-2 type transport system permease protein